MYDQIKLTRQNIHNIECTCTEQLTYILPHYIVNSNQPNKTNLCIHKNDCSNQNTVNI